ncbi:hypothetical protein JQX13_11620 [Archangium violaceum]|uniref:DUF6748 domain-containing protein n=1 Tax=Archangium violaceum TaxID=83451 RepID=UPI00193AF462|nr:DUF6748 domain-containing protein [Archangium violaceum]QRK10660.1 hypothetical protein JQX13_11620 [Archangium violaceum]
MTSSHPLLSAALALGLLAGCSNRTTPEPRPTESTSAPTTQPAPLMETPPTSKPAPSSSASADAAGKRGQALPTDGADTGARDTAAAKPVVYLVKDSGVRCITAPCPSYIATPVDQPGAEGIQITDVDLSALGLPEDRRATLLESVQGRGAGLKVEATVDTVPKAGPGGAATVLRVKKVVEGR